MISSFCHPLHKATAQGFWQRVKSSPTAPPLPHDAPPAPRCTPRCQKVLTGASPGHSYTVKSPSSFSSSDDADSGARLSSLCLQQAGQERGKKSHAGIRIKVGRKGARRPIASPHSEQPTRDPHRFPGGLRRPRFLQRVTHSFGRGGQLGLMFQAPK